MNAEFCTTKQPIRLETQPKLDHPSVVEEGYIVPNNYSVNSEKVAGLIEDWIRKAPAGSITLRSKKWILDQWQQGRGVMVIAHPQEGAHIDMFGSQTYDEQTLSEHIVSVAFLNQLDGIELEDEVELGTVITNPNFQSNQTRRGVGGGVKAFQAIQDRAHRLFPNARLFSWVKNGSLVAIQNAFTLGDSLNPYVIEEKEKAIAVFAGCEGCPGQTSPGMCCHTGFEVANKDLDLSHEQGVN